MNIYVQVLYAHKFSILLVKYIGMGLMSHVGTVCLTWKVTVYEPKVVLKNIKPLIRKKIKKVSNFPIVAVSFSIPTSMCKSSTCYVSLSALVTVWLLILSILIDV